MSDYVQTHSQEAAPSAATSITSHFSTHHDVEEYLGPAPEHTCSATSTASISCALSELCGNQCKKPLPAGEVSPQASYATLNRELTGVQIEGDAKVDRNRKRWVFVYCQHCRRHRRKVRLDSLKRKAKVGSDGKLRKAAMSCGCLSTKSFQRNVAAMANQVPFEKKVKVWTAMKLGQDTFAVAKEHELDRWVVGFATKEIGKLASSLHKESRVRSWFAACGTVRQALKDEDKPSELSFHWERGPKRDRRHGRWVCHMDSEVKRAGKILKKWSYFAKSPVPEVREVMSLAQWVTSAFEAGKARLSARIRRNENRRMKTVGRY